MNAFLSSRFPLVEASTPPVATEALVGLADCNNFYAACEQVFRPAWRGRPLVVLGNNDGNVIARSRQAKALGIPMATPLHQVSNLIALHQVVVCSANFALYGDMSRRVMEILGRYTCQLEVYSIDEAFLDLRLLASVPLYERIAYLTRMREEVARWTGIPLSIGVASTKTLAKAAAKRAKTEKPLGGVCVLSEEADEREALLRALPVGEVWGIGPRRARLLESYGITTAYALASADPRWVRKQLSVTGARTQLELCGVACLPLAAPPARRKQLCVSRSFGRPVTELRDLREAAALFTSHVAERCRGQGSFAGKLSVFVTTNPFSVKEAQYSASAHVRLPCSTANTLELIEAATDALERIFRPGVRYHKLGVVLTHLTPDTVRQERLFADEGATLGAGHRQRARSEALMRTLDAINARFGHDMIRPLSAGIAQPWRMKQTQRSPRYTTQWAELAEVW